MNNAPRDNVSYYNEFSSAYEDRRHHGYHRFLDDLQADFVRDRLSGKERVLELGCGTGLIMQRLLPSVKRITGVDISPGMLEHARARELDVHEASVTDLPFTDESFDLVYSFKVLAHVQDIAKAASEAFRVTAPGGSALLEFYNPFSWRGVRKRLVVDRISGKTRESAVFTRFDSLGRAREILERAGWRYAGHRGHIVLTPFAQLHSLPLAGSLLRGCERVASASALGRAGGFLTVIGRKP